MSAVERARLCVTKEWIVVDSLSNAATALHSSLFFCRTTGKIFEKQERPGLQDSVEYDTVVLGIVGVAELLLNQYLICIKTREYVGKLLQHDIWKASSFQIIPIKLQQSEKDTPKEKVSSELFLLTMLESALKQTDLYYSVSIDLTSSTQKVFVSTPSQMAQPLCLSADPRFFWNYRLIRPLVDRRLYKWITILIAGFIRCDLLTFNSKVVRYTLLSRISTERAGPRYHCRGANIQGRVANFVETEQVITYYEHLLSFRQIRGSIPILWKQTPNLKYKPKPQPLTPHTLEEFLKDYKEAEEINKANITSPFSTLVLHFEHLQQCYGPVVAVSLIDQKGSEATLGDLFQAGIKKNFTSDAADYIAWDFHHLCKGMRFDRVDQLVQRLGPFLERSGYFYTKLGDENFSPWVQKGCIRTNCIDCLDRTNVVQSVIALHVLTNQLRQLKIIDSDKTVKEFPMVYTKFSNIWADHADAISEYYTGTGALKTDYTRTGKRTYRGILVDGWRSLLRYWKNNFADGYKQDAYNLFLGKVDLQRYKSKETVPSYWNQLNWKERMAPFICLLCILFIVWSQVLQREMSFKLKIASLAASLGIFAREVAFIWSHGVHYALQPRLAVKQEE
eukprot:jgi/Galph1/2271/GphlegSOOS_G934.1